ncbi:MAG: helix-turn-helix domain-containing protein [Myxococcota bacterium]
MVADDYGGLVELLSQCTIDRPLLDVEELEDVMQHPWAAGTLDALLRSASVREAARLADVHHSTMQARLESIRDALPFDPTDGIGRTRIGLAFLAWRLRHSTVLQLPPPSERG